MREGGEKGNVKEKEEEETRTGGREGRGARKGRGN